MANHLLLKLLQQGVDRWNDWKKSTHLLLEAYDTDLRDANLCGMNLSEFDFSDADMSGANLAAADLSMADLSSADLTRANLCGADLSDANLSFANLKDADLSSAADCSNANLSNAGLYGAKLRFANLSFASLDGADLRRADLYGADLSGASLQHADLRYADLSIADLDNTDWQKALTGWTVFGNVDLSTTAGLEVIRHEAPSMIGLDTIYRSQGHIPASFLRKAGVPTSFIEYMHSLVGATKPIDYFTVFISFSTRDRIVAEQLYLDLRGQGIRCWYAPYDMKTGAKIRESIDAAILTYDKLLLLLSEHSIASSWVETEVETALEKERQMQERQKTQTVFFPVRLDDAILQTPKPWAKVVRRYHIADFTKWKQPDAYQQAFNRLIRDLKVGEASNN